MRKTVCLHSIQVVSYKYSLQFSHIIVQLYMRKYIGCLSATRLKASTVPGSELRNKVTRNSENTVEPRLSGPDGRFIFGTGSG